MSDNLIIEKAEVDKLKSGILLLLKEVTSFLENEELEHDQFDLNKFKVSVRNINHFIELGRISLYDDLSEINVNLMLASKLIKSEEYSDLDKVIENLDNFLQLFYQRDWYVVNTYSGHENRVKENLQRRVETMGIEDNLFQILVAEEEEVEIRNDKKVSKMKNLYPGYLFVEMIMTDEAWYVVRNTPGVTGFIGSSGGGAKPFPVSDEEIESILRRVGIADTKVVVDFEVGDIVKILNGPFRGIEGSVEAKNDDTSKADILTIMFGRETTTTVDYLDLQKID